MLNGTDHLIDKLPLHLVNIPEINYIFPNAKFIFVTRHPLDCILSNWMQNYSLNVAMANMTDIDRVVKMYVTCMEIFNLCEKKLGINILHIKYEDLVVSLKPETQRILQFLGLEWEEEMQHFNNTAKHRTRITTPSYEQVVQPLYNRSINRWENYQANLLEYKPELNEIIKRLGYE